MMMMVPARASGSAQLGLLGGLIGGSMSSFSSATQGEPHTCPQGGFERGGWMRTKLGGAIPPSLPISQSMRHPTHPNPSV